MERDSHGPVIERSERARARDQKRKMDQTVFQGKYSREVEDQMKSFYESLSEKEKRRYAAIEASKLGHGGQRYICTLLGCSPTTLRVGREEILHGSDVPKGRIRRPGGGKKRITEKIANIDEIFLEIVKDHTAGSPMDEEVKWTNLGLKAISKAFQERGYNVSEHVVKQLLKKHKYVQRKMQKTKTVKEAEHRDEQFKNINRIKEEHMNRGDPVISLDVKKKKQ
jgi:uncharacterized protein (UPF0297 family)